MGRGENPVVLLGGVVEGMGREELPQLTLGEAVGEKNFESRIEEPPPKGGRGVIYCCGISLMKRLGRENSILPLRKRDLA